MDLALLCPLPVGAVTWAAPEPRITLIVKATFALDRDGELELARDQRPLEIDRAGASNDDLAIAGDFAPHKERVDVLLMGHAHASAPTTAIEAAIEVADVRRSFVAIAPLPTTRVPLDVKHLRSGPPANVPVRVGPLGPRSAARRALAGDYALDAEGAPVGPLAGDFDFGFFNAAPLPQQLDALPPGAAITISGLLAGAPRREVTAPRRRPLVMLVDAQARRAQALGVRCDTLVIDADRAEITLTWRGAFDAAAAPEGAVALVAYEPAGTRWSAPEVRHRLEHATRGRAETPARAPASRATRARSTTLIAPESPLDARPVTPFERADPPRITPAPRAGATKAETLPFSHAGAASALPFVAGRSALLDLPAPRAPLDRYDGRSTIVFDEPTDHAAGAALPFPAAHAAVEPAPAPPREGGLPFRAAPPRDAEVTALTVAHARAPAASLPFHTPAEVEATEEEPEPPTIPPPPPRGPALIDEADEYDAPAREPPPPNVDLMPVDAYVAIVAELSNGKKREVLARHGLSSKAWKAQERLQIEAVEREAMIGLTARAEALSASLDRAGIG